ncbi:MAG TPA: PilZ domain-containing protein [Bdellovibrionales bacterium]|nr:PilZ domain-containing protein [Bdellovibrionales bacterium]
MSGGRDLPYAKLRRFTRVLADAMVGVQCDGRYRVHPTAEISEGGLLFTSSKPYPVGKSIEMSILLQNERPLLVSGEISYSFKQRDTHHVGVRFLEPSTEVQATLRLFIQREKRR